MPEKHAILSASSSSRWIHCPPSVRLSEGYGETSSEYAAQGTDAHTLSEYKLKKALGIKVRDPTKKLKYYDGEMERCSTEYAAYVMEELAKIKNPAVFVEQHLDFSQFVVDGFGTGDCVILGENKFVIIDFKYGQGIRVNAKDNSQLRCYALGVIQMFDEIFDFSEVRMCIFQPRIDHVDEEEMEKDSLLDWAANVLTPASVDAYAGTGEFNCGDWCRWCKAKAICRKRTEYNLELAKYDFKMPDTLTDEEISVVLRRAEELSSWAAEVQGYALQKALAGKKYEGWKIVEGRSVRKFKDPEQVAKIVESAGFEPFEKKLKGITALTNLMGRDKFNELLAASIEKPPGKPTLVPEDDERLEMKSSAQEDFA